MTYKIGNTRVISGQTLGNIAYVNSTSKPILQDGLPTLRAMPARIDRTGMTVNVKRQNTSGYVEQYTAFGDAYAGFGYIMVGPTSNGPWHITIAFAENSSNRAGGDVLIPDGWWYYLTNYNVSFTDAGVVG